LRWGLVAREAAGEHRGVEAHAGAQAPPVELQVEAIEPLPIGVVDDRGRAGVADDGVVAVVEVPRQRGGVGHVDGERLAADVLDVDGARVTARREGGEQGGDGE
jgi:hypothetical protein